MPFPKAGPDMIDVIPDLETGIETGVELEQLPRSKRIDEDEDDTSIYHQSIGAKLWRKGKRAEGQLKQLHTVWPGRNAFFFQWCMYDRR